MKKLLIPIGTLFVSGIIHAQLTPTENYIQSRTYLEPITISSSTAKQIETVQYFDGLGRPKQIVNIKASPTGKDVVTYVEYDTFGRQTKDYLPVPQQGTQNGAIYSSPLSNATQPALYGGEKIFSEKILESSPLGRILQQKQVGNDWDTKPIQFGYSTNTIGDNIKKFTTITTWENKATKSDISQTVNYGTAELYKNTITDEDGNQTIEFKNREGQVLLVRKVLNATENADTYYVYNEYDQLAFIIPPKASVATDININNILKELCYQYKYDARNRIVEKKIPGKGWEYMVYDKADRLILSQDTNLKEQNKWLITKYDLFGRIIYTGFLATGGERAARQNEINELVITESRSTSGFTKNGMTVFYTDSYFLNEIPVILSVNYYDTYPQYNFNPLFPTSILGEVTLTDVNSSNERNTKNFLVMSLVKNIEDDNWTKNYIYYDTKGRTIGNYSINHLGGYTKTETELSFAGLPKQTITRHTRLISDTERIITETFMYDNQNRLLVHKHKLGNGQEEILAQNNYNELSQLKNKKVGGSVLGNGLQSLDYTYNIRGWMTQINDPSDLGSDLFGYKIKYQNPVFTNIAEGKYNGNITEVDWKSSTDAILKRYNYQYDGLNRLLKGEYSEPESSLIENHYFDEKLTYDLNGNIKTLQRFTNPSSGLIAEKIDDLVYNYENNNYSNKLSQITLPPNVVNNMSGYNALGNIYEYDLNGNITKNLDKGIYAITYNYLNQINYVNQDNGFVTTKYMYQSNGNKIRKIEEIPFILKYKKTTDYLDGFQYETLIADASNAPHLNAILKFIHTSEGYYDFEKNSYFYQYKDHLNNIRLTYRHNNVNGIEIAEQKNFYPFGLDHAKYFHNQQENILPEYAYAYNGKEYQGFTGMYDYGARMYMPELGIWGTVDPLAEKMTRHSPYNYAFNNPIMFIDPDGREGEDWFTNSFGDMEFRDDIQSQKDMDDKGVSGTYVGETHQDGDLKYAADGYIYDDSAAGGGRAVANGRTNNIEEITMTGKRSVGRQVWNFAADNIISKPVEGIEFFAYFFYGLGQVPGEMYKQGRMENIHVKMDMTLWGFKNGSLVRTMKYVDGETVMTEQEKFEKIAIPGIEVLSLGVGAKLNLVKQPVINFGAKMGIKTAVKKSIYNAVEN